MEEITSISDDKSHKLNNIPKDPMMQVYMMTVHITIWTSLTRTLTVGCGYNDLRLASWFFLKIVFIIYHLCSLSNGYPLLSLILQRHRTLVWSFRPSQYLLKVSCWFSYSSLFRIFSAMVIFGIAVPVNLACYIICLCNI